MEKYKIKNLENFKVKNNENEEEYYGFSQEWYKDLWQQTSGCGATVASSIINYCNLKEKFSDTNKDKALKIMEELWFYLLPTHRGLNSTDLFIEGIQNYYSHKDKKVKIECINIRHKEKDNFKEVVKFIEFALSEDLPIAFLNLSNGEEKNLDEWHWVVVIGISKEENIYFLEIIDDKKIIKINLSLWYETMKDDGGFIYYKFI